MKVRGFWRGPQVIRRIKGDLSNGLRRFAEDYAEAARANCPVDTGLLRSTITTSMNLESLSVSIIADTDYSRYVHDGTSRMEARPFLTIAYAIMAPRARDYFVSHST